METSESLTQRSLYSRSPRMAKFRKKPFRKWLDCLAKVIVKTRDDWTCQIQHDDECSGEMQPLSFNCQWCHIKSRNSNNFRWDLLNALTGCGHCHQWAHANPHEFGVWFEAKYPHRYKYLIQYIPIHTWRESHYREVEKALISKAKDLNIRPEVVPQAHRKRFMRAMK